MGIEFKEIEPEFNKLRAFTLDDLNRILSHESGGNYAATVLIVCACDALARYRYGSENAGHHFFVEMMLPENWKKVGRWIYEALRNGIVHLYEPKTIMVDGRKLQLGVSWEERAHLTLSPDGKWLYLNVKQMARDLEKAFGLYRTDLEQNSDLRDQFYKMSKKGIEVTVQGSNEIASWKKLLGNAHKADACHTTNTHASYP